VAPLIQNPKSKIRNRRGFSLVEVLMAIGILTIALVMVGTSFPVGVAMTTNVAERTIAAVVADEAFAKMRIYGISLGSANWNRPVVPVPLSGGQTAQQRWVPYREVMPAAIPDTEFAYPSDPAMIEYRQSVYYWSALCRRELDAAGNPTRQVRVVVFVSRKAGEWTRFPRYCALPNPVTLADPDAAMVDYPRPVLIFRDIDNSLVLDAGDSAAPGPLVLTRQLNPGRYVPMAGWRLSDADSVRQSSYLSAGCFVLDDDTGEIYRVIERTETRSGQTVLRFVVLDRDFIPAPVTPAMFGYKFWVVAPGAGTTRNPCIAVYQKVIRF
jgi:prepilin-type N-terminal cleavage/methylation domain-containing protein